MNTALNRRTMMTKRIFRETLTDMLQTKQISEISVKQLCEKADMNRSTFYMHYQNTIELLEEIELDTYDQLADYILEKRVTKEQKQVEILRDILEFAKSNIPLFRMLLGQNEARKFQQDMLYISTKYTSTKHTLPKKISHYIEFYHFSGCIAVIKEWLDCGAVESAEEMSQLIVSLNEKDIILKNN